MAVNLKKRRAAKAVTKTVDVDGDALNITFVPKSFTVGVLQSLREAESKNAPDAVLVPIILQTVTGWDIEDGDGETVPITAEALAELPLDILNVVLEAVLGETTPSSRLERLRQFRLSDGRWAKAPEEYTLMEVARFLGVTPWALEKAPAKWFVWGLAAMNAERERAAQDAKG